MSWLSSILAPVRFFLGETEQRRDDRVSFRNGFTSSQVPDADGKNVLTFDTEVGAATVTPDANKVVKRNGSGVAYATTFVGNAFSYATPITLQFDEPMDPNSAPSDVNWTLGFDRFPVAGATGISWVCDIKPPHESILKTVSVVYTPPGAHMALPAGTDRPSLALIAYGDDGTPDPLGSVYDDPVDAPTYEVNRTLTLDLGDGIEIDRALTYRLIFQTEDGVNALVGTALYRQARWTAEVYNPICK